jgi:hypothetical protein
MDKAEILKWAKKYDKDEPASTQVEQQLGMRFRKNRMLNLEDLTTIAEWKFKEQEQKKTKVLDAITKNDNAALTRVSSQVFSVVGVEDAYRVNSLCMLNGVSPVLASVILAFYDPKHYGIFDVAVWRALLGNEPPGLYTMQNYLRLLASLRKVASKHNLDARTVEKALFKKATFES